MSFLRPAGAAAAMITAGGPGGEGGEGDCNWVEGVVGVVDLVDLVNEDLDADDPTTGGGDGMRSPALTAAAIWYWYTGVCGVEGFSGSLSSISSPY